MSNRGPTPGLVRRKRKSGARLYWAAASLTTQWRAYPEPLIPLPSDATPGEIADLCETYAARLDLWLAGESRGRRYDGTIASLCDVYESHPQSAIHEVRANTAKSYRDSLKVLRKTVGARAVRAVVPIDVKTWYANWRRPAQPGGPERVKRAHDAVAMLRMVLRFGSALGHVECRNLVAGLEDLRFEKSGRRASEMTVDHVRAFVAKAIELRGPQIGLAMAIGTVTQFETALRQKDVIGEWRQPRTPAEHWEGLYRWDNIPGGLWRMQTSKTGKVIVFDLTGMELLWPLLQQVPQAERHGAIVKGEHGLPIRERSYRKWFREIARAAGIPDQVWNMDARAGAITEALEAGVDLATVSRGATHATTAMTETYAKRIETPLVTITEARKRARRKP